ncbi:protein LRATD1 [Carcharodon carcharias]|uniref:protein LRATD1 n=1 Tax=Carcharodon carcharias TaxID=13397 RepID=UPI001B7ECCB9|nr:protein LRATD1 [Carcharodon carcharias]XP_041044712.1 protein LRATD1 [Carcharodon carcharias]XP_041044713.1 protein LRATD1 [Carcharodon carcharias]
MGNQIDRITHLNYSELPTGDPSGVEKDELRVGVAYFFSDEEDEVDVERAPAELQWPEPSPQQDEPASKGGTTTGTGTAAPAPAAGELEYSAFCRQECIFSKLGDSQDLRVYSVNSLLPRCRAGDLLELPASSGQAAHWAVYVGGSQVVHLHQQEIRQDHLAEVGGGRLARIVNTWYRYRALPPELVVQNARGHLGLKGHDVCWTDSESFAAWCRFGKREFKAGGEGQSGGGGGERRYFLKLHLSDNWVHTLNFASLEDLIREKRRKDASGKIRVLKELSILNHK